MHLLAEQGGSSWIDDQSDLFRVANGISTAEDIRSLPKLVDTLIDWSSIQIPPFYVVSCEFFVCLEMRLI